MSDVSIVLETPRLIVRRWEDSDVPVVAPIYAKPEVMRCIPGGVWDSERTQQTISRMRAIEQRQGFGFYPLVEKESGALVGHAGLGRLEAGEEIEVAYVLDVPFWGKGLATEAARAFLEDGFARLGLTRIVAVAFAENPASIAVMKCCGMRSCGMAQHFGREVVKYEALSK
ncbi:MAG TPA: GNAT family N-acetyltransferase [Candidatus Cybelea sp.]|jgi:RimJ/RimL family protein N-acetyltransferase|nr:GNAT family N-acetyltransferase [Candidatus Cybelea sp.]